MRKQSLISMEIDYILSLTLQQSIHPSIHPSSEMTHLSLRIVSFSSQAQKTDNDTQENRTRL